VLCILRTYISALALFIRYTFIVEIHSSYLMGAVVAVIVW